MPDDLPPPGPERDRLVAEALGCRTWFIPSGCWCGGFHDAAWDSSTHNHAALDALEAWRNLKASHYAVMTLGTSARRWVEVALGDDMDNDLWEVEVAATLGDAATAAIIRAARRGV